MAYKQRFNYSKGYIEVEYTITPDIGSNVFIDDEITVEGTIFHTGNENIIRCIALLISWPGSMAWDEGSYEVGYINKNIKADVQTNFKIVGKIPEKIDTHEMYISFGVKNAPGPFYEGDRTGAEVQLTGSDGIYQYYNVHAYVFSVLAEEMQLNRASYSAGAYLDDDEGSYIICRKIKLALDKSIVISNITKKQFNVVAADNSTNYTINISDSAFNAMVSSNGYSESTPSIFSGRTFSSTKSYNVYLIIGMFGVEKTYKFVISSSFANMHLSGAADGGVSFGGFSSSTAGNPKLESYYKAYMYEGFSDETLKLIGNAMYPVGSIFLSLDNTSPQTLFGGRWEAMQDRLLIGSGKLSPSTYSFASSGSGDVKSVQAMAVNPGGYAVQPMAEIDPSWYYIVNMWRRTALFE